MGGIPGGIPGGPPAGPPGGGIAIGGLGPKPGGGIPGGSPGSGGAPASSLSLSLPGATTAILMWVPLPLPANAPAPVSLALSPLVLSSARLPHGTNDGQYVRSGSSWPDATAPLSDARARGRCRIRARRRPIYPLDPQCFSVGCARRVGADGAARIARCRYRRSRFSCDSNNVKLTPLPRPTPPTHNQHPLHYGMTK